MVINCLINHYLIFIKLAARQNQHLPNHFIDIRKDSFQLVPSL